MNPLKTLLRHTSHYLGGRVALMLLGFVSFPIYTRAFSVADYGVLTLIQSSVLVLTVIAKFGFQHSIQRYYPERIGSPDPAAIGRCYSTLFYATAVFGIALTMAFGGTAWLGIASTFAGASFGTLVLASSLIFIRALRSMQLNLMQVENKTKLFNATEIFQKAGGVAITILLLFTWKRDIEACFVGMVLIEGAVLCQYTGVLARRGLLSPSLFDQSFFRAALLFSFPLMLAEISWIGLVAGDRFLVEHYLGLVPLGFYAAACGIAVCVQEVVTAPLQLSFFPICMKLWTAEGHEATQRFLSRSLNYFAMFSVLIVCIASVSSREAIILLASAKFQEARIILPFLIIGLVLSSANTFFRPGLMINKQVGKIAQATLIGCLTNIALNLALLPRFGLMGAALASTLSFLAMVTYSGFCSLRTMPFKIEWIALLRYIATGTLASWIVVQIPVQNPLVRAATKCLLLFILYSGLLWLIDSRFREGVSKLSVHVAGYWRLRARASIGEGLVTVD
jgi:O-antigen/teichoic acid export membrane protein